MSAITNLKPERSWCTGTFLFSRKMQCATITLIVYSMLLTHDASSWHLRFLIQFDGPLLPDLLTTKTMSFHFHEPIEHACTGHT